MEGTETWRSESLSSASLRLHDSMFPMSDPAITPEVIAKHGITPDEYERIKAILGREPNFTELGVFSVMWSEHCSLQKFQARTEEISDRPARSVLVKAGEENAGVIDIGDGWAIAFKMESHNHPSAVEPFQGAATGVGGIIRDIFTMGARPVFSLNSLRFGPIAGRICDREAAKSERTAGSSPAWSAGIAHYGNCIGIPTDRRRGLFRRILHRQSARQRPLPRHPAPRADRARRRRSASAIRSFTSARRPGATAWPARRSPRAN